MTRNLALASLALALAACATSTTMTSEQRQAAVSAAPAWELCWVYISGKAISVARDMIAQEMQRRPIDCRDHMAMVQAKMQADAVAQQQSMQQSQQQMETAMKLLNMSRAPAGNPGGGMCLFQREWTSGLNKNCVYSCAGSEAVQTVSSVALCPLSITR